MHTFSQLAQVLPRQTAEGIDKFLPDLEKLINEDASYDLILDTLAVLKRLFKIEEDRHGKFQKNFQKIYNVINKTL